MHKFFSFAGLALLGVLALPARADLTITLSDGVSAPVTCALGAVSAGACNLTDAAYTVAFSTAIVTPPPGGSIDFQAKTLNILSTAAAIGHPLTLEVASTNYFLPTGPVSMTESVTANNPLPTSFGTVTGQGYISPTNTAFDTSGPTTGPAVESCTAKGVGSGCSSKLDSSLGNWLGTATATGSTTISSVPFALNEVLTVNVTTPGAANFSGDFGVSSVPEPASIMLLGTGLIGAGLAFRRRLQAKRR